MIAKSSIQCGDHAVANWFWDHLARNKRRCLDIRNRWYAEREWPGEIFLQEIRSSPGDSFLEIGCGRRGGMLYRVADRFKRTVGLDPECEGVESEDESVQLIAGDVHSIPFPDATFDVVAMLNVAEHFEAPRAAFHECARVMKPGARLIVQTVNQWFPPIVVSQLFPHRLRVFLNKIASGTVEDDTFPAFYRVNTLKRLRKCAEVVSLEPLTLKYLPHHPTYLLFSPIVYQIAVVFERIFRRIEGLSRLRPVIQGVFAKVTVPAPSPASWRTPGS